MGLQTHATIATAFVWGITAFSWLLALRPAEWSKVFYYGPQPPGWWPAIVAHWGLRLTILENTIGVSADVGFVSCGSREVVSTLQSSSFAGPRLIHLHD
jgi:hypothetical protein